MQTDAPTNTFLDYALNYAREMGFAVFPLHGIDLSGACSCGIASCKNPGKHPRTAHGFKDATIDCDQIDVWWAQWPDANIGIATGPVSGIIVVDVDVVKGGKSSDLFFDGLDATVLTTPRVKTGGGTHYYYKFPAGSGITISASQLAPFVDIRGAGGYVVAPPSKHFSGKSYEWISDNLPIAEFPQQWIDKLSTKPRVSTNGNGSAAAPANPFVVPTTAPRLVVPKGVDLGKRNNTLIKLAGGLRRDGYCEAAIYGAISAENQRICQPPLDDKEVHDIAHSAGRYAPATPIDPVTDDDPAAPDYENTLTAFSLGQFLDSTFPELEVLAFHISRTEIGIIQAPTNAGKTTILRNVALAMGCGRPFMPFFDGHRPIKLAYFDFESSAQRAQPDFAKMIDALTPVERALARENIALIPKGMRNGELFQFNTGEDWVSELLTKNGIEFVFVDNISAAYDLNDENSNAEINRKVIKPLLKLAYKGDCAFLFAHHYGKGKASEIEAAGVHAGRGASNLQSLSQTVINMFGNVSKGEPITFECAKRKTDGGQNYREVFELKDDRWFHPTLIAPPPKARSCAETLNDYINTNCIYPDTVTPADLADEFDGVFGLDMINKALSVLSSNGFIAKQGRGEYCARKKKTAPAKSIKNFYDKDDDQDAPEIA